MGALLVIEILPVTVPLLAGAKLTFKLVLCPPATTTGRLMPLSEKPEPLAEACEIVMLVLPEFVSAIVWLADLPVTTSPKSA